VPPSYSFIDTLASRLPNLLKNIGIVSVAHAVTLGLSTISGILVVRWLSPQEYALFVTVSAFLITINAFTDAGLTNAVMTELRQVISSKVNSGIVMASGAKLRRVFYLIVYPLALPISAYGLFQQDVQWLEIGILISVMVVTSVLLMEASLCLVPIRLNQLNAREALVNISASLVRLTLICSLLLVAPTALTGLFAGLVAAIVAFLGLKSIANKLFIRNLAPDPECVSNIAKFVKITFPSALYFSFSSQIAVWLALLFSNAQGIAAVGALGRIGLLMSVVPAIFGAVIIPRFAKAKEEYSTIVVRYWLSIVALVVMIAVFLLPMFVAPSSVLSLLGSDFAHLQRELQICMFGSGIYCLYAGLHGLCISRGWAPPAHYLVMTSLVSQIILISIFDSSTVSGILWITGLSYLPGVVFYLFTAIAGLARIRTNNQE